MRDWFKARNIWGAAIMTLSDAEAGRLAKALWQYTMTGEEAELSGSEKAVLAMFLMTLRQDEADNLDLSDKRAAAGAKGGKQKQANAAERVANVANVANATNKNKNKNKNKEKEEDKDKEYEGVPPIPPTRETDFGLVEADPIILTVQRHLAELTETHYQELQDYRETLGDELVLKAINDTVANGVHAWAYVRAILQGFLRDGIKTVADAEQRDERRRQNKGGGGKEMRDQSYTQREYTDAELNGFAADLIKEAEAYA